MSEEKELIRMARMGDVCAFERLVSGYEKKVYNTAYRFFDNVEDAKDVTQEIIIKIFTSLKHFREGSSFSTWLYRIAVNTCIDFSRKKKEDFLPLQEGFDENASGIIGEYFFQPEAAAESKELKKALGDAIQALPEDQRICVVLRDIQGFSYMEIGNILNCSQGTVKSRISRGRRTLRELLLKMELFNEKNV
ncbi:MAG: sigma-70 family RNA polymerase sigma factor [Tepidanaerobacteraceae bacterium]|nr:sigma-70 family RNA polymerase sigma factor [Tepidanaerobacteraceae bacterium]